MVAVCLTEPNLNSLSEGALLRAESVVTTEVSAGKASCAHQESPGAPSAHMPRAVEASRETCANSTLA